MAESIRTIQGVLAFNERTWTWDVENRELCPAESEINRLLGPMEGRKVEVTRTFRTGHEIEIVIKTIGAQGQEGGEG